MRSGPVAIVGVLLALALLAPACGGGEGAAAEGEKTSEGVRSTTASPPEPARARAVAIAGPGKRCGRTLGEFLDAMESLANSLAVGLDYERYLESVNRVRGVYARVDPERLGLVCLGRVAGPAERSLNAYINAANAWGECLAESGCETESVEPRLQREWEEAADLLSGAAAAVASAGSPARRADGGRR